MSIVQTQTLRIQVYQIIKGKILSGEYPPKSKLNEISISEELGVSRSPVREAIQQLASEGFAVIEHNRGAFVKELSFEEYVSTHEMRLLIERFAAERVATAMDEDTRKEFQAVHNELSEMDENNLSREAYGALDMKLHTLIVRGSGNVVAQEIFQMLYSRIELYRGVVLNHKSIYKRSYMDHKKILEAILNQNPKVAVEIVEQHLLCSYQGVIDYLKESALLKK